MIQLNQLTLKAEKQLLLRNVSFVLQRGEKAVLQGPSGCGKSSLLKSLVGLFPIKTGEVRVDGIELHPSTVADIRGRVAFVGQEPELLEEGVLDALLLPFSFRAHRHLKRPTRSEILRLLDRLRLPEELLTRTTDQLSGGEKQRLVILRALLLKKELFLLDELTSALDPESREAVIETLLTPSFSVLSISHDAAWIASCGRTLLFKDQTLYEE